MSPAPTHDSRVMRLARTFKPGFGWCGRCGVPWGTNNDHTTEYRDGYGCFPLCESCWGRLDVAGRIPYYRRLIVGEWGAPDVWPDVLRAVVAGR